VVSLRLPPRFGHFRNGLSRAAYFGGAGYNGRLRLDKVSDTLEQR